ncbi:hypothetical protein ACO0LB_16950 [Undibacterium sp. SXout7W]|uniref:hypothetical protein n=1 Tax=Undibacterium sp. SXout7W TaxID=3413049 RepID=UPI003BEFC2D2
MHKIFRLLFPRQSLVAISGLYSSAIICSLMLFYWSADLAIEMLYLTENDVRYKGLAIIIGMTVIRHYLIIRGKDIVANWLNKK